MQGIYKSNINSDSWNFFANKKSRGAGKARQISEKQEITTFIREIPPTKRTLCLRNAPHPPTGRRYAPEIRPGPAKAKHRPVRLFVVQPHGIRAHTETFRGHLRDSFATRPWHAAAPENGAPARKRRTESDLCPVQGCQGRCEDSRKIRLRLPAGLRRRRKSVFPPAS